MVSPEGWRDRPRYSPDRVSAPLTALTFQICIMSLIQHGPFDLTLIKIGGYDDSWPDIHLNPEQAVEAHASLRGKVLLPIQWGTFNLAFHRWNEPADRVVAASAGGTILVVPRPGESFEPATPAPVRSWWR